MLGWTRMKDELLLRLESFELDKPGASFPFSARLARDNGWSRGYARRVLREYLRFVWLAMRAGHPVTPSEQIDEAWHLHLCYTRSYWDDLCGGVLGKPLHHDPTEGGTAEDAKFTGWYARTLESYRLHFGEEPPADIWPPAMERFRPAPARKAGTRGTIPTKAALRWSAGVAALAILPVLAGCTPMMALGSEAASSLVIAAAFLVMIVALAIVAARKQRGNSSDSGGGGTSGCSSHSSGCGSSSDGDSGGGSSGCSSSSGCGSSGCGGGGGCGGGCGGGGD